MSSGHAELALISLQGRIFPVPRWLLFVDVARRAEVKAGAARPHPEGALTAARCDVIVLRLWGNRNRGGPWGIEVEVSVSFATRGQG